MAIEREPNGEAGPESGRGVRGPGKRTALRVASFVVVGVALGIGLVRWVSDRSLLERGGGYDLTAVIPDASCLADGSPVRVSGVRVGRVVKRELVSGGAKITMHIENEEVDVTPSATLTKKRLSALGDGNCYLDLAPQGPADKTGGA
jgi:ABC-type transporter Mla subunit MlaD